jgi:hypothetical protein
MDTVLEECFSPPPLLPYPYLIALSNPFTIDTDFKQQRLKAWQPILTPNWVIGTFAIVGLIFVPIGSVLKTESDNVSPITASLMNAD